ncbi:MAG: hypothetical protein WEA35_07295 [Candidatus Nanopelagicales bacterium]
MRHVIILSVWWFYTIVLGMAFGQVSRNLAMQVKDARLHPERRGHLPTILWEIFLLLLIVQVWVAVTYYRETLDVLSVLELAAFLAVPLAIFLLATMLSDNDSDGDEGAEGAEGDPDGDQDSTGPDGAPADPQERAFSRLRPIFFGVLITMIAVNIVHSLARGDLEMGIDLYAQVLLILGAILGFFLSSRRADAILATAMIATVVAYIALAYDEVSVSL